MAAERPFWLTAFLDFPASEFDAGSAFWSRATGFGISVARGEFGEFATLTPPAGDDYLRLQRLGTGPTRLHLDVHVTALWDAAATAESLGAELLDDSSHSYLVWRSPGGIVFCLVGQPAAQIPDAAVWSGHRSRVHEVCWDVPRARFPAEMDFWQRLLPGEWIWQDSAEASTRAGGEYALALRLQPAEIAREVVGHLHLETDGREAEVARLVAAGAVVRSVRTHQTMLETPGGVPLCVLDLRPGSR